MNSLEVTGQCILEFFHSSICNNIVILANQHYIEVAKLKD